MWRRLRLFIISLSSLVVLPILSRVEKLCLFPASIHEFVTNCKSSAWRERIEWKSHFNCGFRFCIVPFWGVVISTSRRGCLSFTKCWLVFRPSGRGDKAALQRGRWFIVKWFVSLAMPWNVWVYRNLTARWYSEDPLAIAESIRLSMVRMMKARCSSVRDVRVINSNPLCQWCGGNFREWWALPLICSFDYQSAKAVLIMFWCLDRIC